MSNCDNMPLLIRLSVHKKGTSCSFIIQIIYITTVLRTECCAVNGP